MKTKEWVLATSIVAYGVALAMIMWYIPFPLNFITVVFVWIAMMNLLNAVRLDRKRKD